MLIIYYPIFILNNKNNELTKTYKFFVEISFVRVNCAEERSNDKVRRMGKKVMKTARWRIRIMTSFDKKKMNTED